MSSEVVVAVCKHEFFCLIWYLVSPTHCSDWYIETNPLPDPNSVKS